MCKRHFFSIGFLSCVVASGSVQSAPVEFTFEGTIDAVLGTFNPPFDTITTGQTYTFRFVFESTTPDSDASPTVGVYIDTVQSFETTIGASSLIDVPDASFIMVDDETVSGQESYEVGIGVLSFIFGGQAGLPVGTLSSDALPTTFDLADLSGFQFSVFDVITEGSAFGSLTAFSDGEDGGDGVPAASTWGVVVMLLVALAAGTLVFAKRRRQLV